MSKGNTIPRELSINIKNGMLYSDAISAVWSWWDAIGDPSYALREDLDIWSTALRDPKVYQAVQQRLNAIAGREWRVMPQRGSSSTAGKTKAAIVDGMLRRIPHFQDARRRLAQSVFRGQATELICGKKMFERLGGRGPMMWWMPTGLEHIDPRRFMVRPIRERRQDGTTKIRGQLYMSVIPTFQQIPGGKPTRNDFQIVGAGRGGPYPEGRTNQESHEREALWYGRYVPVEHPEWFVRIVYDDEESRLGFGRPLMDAIYFYLWVKAIVWKEGLQGLERFVHGVPVITLDPGLRGDTDQDSETIRDTALEKLQAMRSGHAYALNKGETLQYMEPGSTGHQMVMGFLDYIDRSLMAVITGANLRSGGDPGNTGSYASDAAGMEMSEAVVQFDRDKIDEDLSLDLIGLICSMNREQFKALEKIENIPGLADEPNPVFVTVVKKPVDPLVAMQLVTGAQQVPGMKLLKSEVYEKLGFSLPEEEEDVFEGGGSVMQPAAQGVDPETGEPLPPGMPHPAPMGDVEEEDDGSEDFPHGFPEDTDTLFGEGMPEDDESLFSFPEIQDAQRSLSGDAGPGHVPDDGQPLPEGAVGGAPAGPEPAAAPEEASAETTVSVKKETPDAPSGDITVKVQSGGPSKNVEIEGMEEQRKKARE